MASFVKLPIRIGIVVGETSGDLLAADLCKELKRRQIPFSVSGIAGPNGATKNKPVGTVVIGISSSNDHKIVNVHNFDGTREEVQIQAAKTSLKEILKFIKKALDK